MCDKLNIIFEKKKIFACVKGFVCLKVDRKIQRATISVEDSCGETFAAFLSKRVEERVKRNFRASHKNDRTAERGVLLLKDQQALCARTNADRLSFDAHLIYEAGRWFYAFPCGRRYQTRRSYASIISQLVCAAFKATNPPAGSEFMNFQCHRLARLQQNPIAVSTG